MIRPPPRPTLFPDTTPSRSRDRVDREHQVRELDEHEHEQQRRGDPPAILHCEEVWAAVPRGHRHEAAYERSEEHTSELQSRQYLVCRLLLEKTDRARPLLRV